MVFSAGSYEGAYLGVRNRVRFCQKLKKAQNYDFLSYLAAAKADRRANFIHHRILSCRHGALRTVEV